MAYNFNAFEDGVHSNSSNRLPHNEGGALAEWSKALQLREKINENEKIPGSPPGLGNLEKTPLTWLLKKAWQRSYFL